MFSLIDQPSWKRPGPHQVQSGATKQKQEGGTKPKEGGEKK